MPKTVAIVGAGFAGLAAAKAIRCSGCDDFQAILLEGGHRVGGRAFTENVPGLGRVEYGATYFHGLEEHPLYEAACQLDLMDNVQSKEHRWGFARQAQEAVLSREEAQPVQAALKQFAAAVEASVAAGQQQQAAGDSSYSIGEHLSTALLQEGADSAPKERERRLQAWRWHELQLRINTAAPSSRRISTAWWGDYEELPGPNLPISCGFQAIAEGIAAGLDIRYGHCVDSIAWGENDVHISCTNGASFQVDAVIVTVSLGVLKAQHAPLFKPALPATKVAAINAMGFGVCEKTFAQWQPSDADADAGPPAHEQPCVAYQLLWDVPFPDAPPDQPARGPTQSTADSSSHSRHDDSVPWFATGLFSFRFGGSEFKPDRPSTAVSSTAQAEIQRGAQAGDFPRTKYTGQDGRIFGNSSGEVAHAAAAHTPAGLPSEAETQQRACLWLAGAHAQQMDRASDEEVAQGIQNVTKAFPAIASGVHADRLPKIWRSHWGDDPLFLGSYSYMTGACDAGTVQALAEPVNGQVFFAGEAVSSKYMGTMHAAYLTGQAAAREVFQKLSGSKL